MAAKPPVELTGKAAIDLFGDIPDPMDTTDSAWCAAVNLFYEIEKRHGEAEARKIFKALAAPSKKRRKHLLDSQLRFLIRSLQKEHGWDSGAMEKAAEHLTKNDFLKLLGLPRGTTKNTLRKRINRLFKSPR
jgi:hypothetical protein